MDNVLVVVMGSCFILVGVATGVFFCYRIFQSLLSRQWPSVTGQLLSSELREVVYRGRDAGGGPDEASAWVVDFSYRYSLRGTDYTGTRVTFSDGINKTMRALRKLQASYAGKSDILVYYNPSNPAQSVLVPGPSLFNFTPLITSSLFVAAGVFILTHDFA